MSSGTAVASPNIAFIKYWGNRDPDLRLPSNGSISMTLGGLETRCTVTFDPNLAQDQLVIHDDQRSGEELARTSSFLDQIRALTGDTTKALVESESNFPAGTGIASSASAFAAMTVAALGAVGLEVDPQRASTIARLGSGSASRSIFGGFVEMLTGNSHEDGHSTQLAPAEHWDLVDLIVIVREEPKSVGSSYGHQLAESSPIQAARVIDSPRRLSLCREAIKIRDFDLLVEILELDSNLMHAVMMTSNPPLLYWEPATVSIMKAILDLREKGLSACYTIDAGPNVHCICTAEDADEVEVQLRKIPEIGSILRSTPGTHARIL